MRPSASQSRSGARRPLSRGLRAQTGAAAIEAALLFVIFFTLFYAIVSYSLPLMIMQAVQHAASEGARAAVAVDPNAEHYQDKVKSQAINVALESVSWLPQPPDVNAVPTGDILTVTVQFNYTNSQLMIPILSFPGIGEVPNLPKDQFGNVVLIGRAKVQL
jgi:Flp pilus assembly protein TadG